MDSKNSICLRDSLHTHGWLSRGRTTRQSCSRSRRAPETAPSWLSTSLWRTWEDSRAADLDSTRTHRWMWSGQTWRRSVCDPDNIFTIVFHKCFTVCLWSGQYIYNCVSQVFHSVFVFVIPTIYSQLSSLSLLKKVVASSSWNISSFDGNFVFPNISSATYIN